ncbi:MAG: serine/threonine-protein phosphatase [Myxococcales bacterium]|nr:serine/threonine-protein phosphatase [Myxococcales bacterium]
MTIRYAARTDVGMRRTHNEDCFGILEAECMVMVADGMGGHAAGEVAAGLALAEVGLFYHQTCVEPARRWPFEREPSLGLLENRVVCGFKVANQRIFDAAEQLKELYPEMTLEEERNFPHKNVITRALGLSEDVEVDVQLHSLNPGDRFLLCSDGLTGHLSDEDILELLGGAQDLVGSVKDLVDLANQRGGQDNITAVALAVS